MIAVQALANTILMKSFTESVDVSPMKIQKLIYFVFRDFLQKHGKKLFSEEFETWKYGPVLPSVYYEFNSFGPRPITKFSRDAQGNVTIIDKDKAPQIIEVIDDVWRRYKNYNGIELSKMTHEKGTAWYKAFMKDLPTLDIEDIANEGREAN